jgi:hypothetical protein
MTDIVGNVLSNPIFPAIGLALAGTGTALWIAGSWWAYHDASWRTGSTFLGLVAAGWIAVSSPLLLPLSLGVYALVRPQQTAAEGRSRRLAAALVDQLDAEAISSCPMCTATVDRDWLRCPECATWISAPCSSCGGWSDRNLEICPWCGNEERDAPAVEDLRPVAAAGVVRKQRRKQQRRQPVGVLAFDSRQPRGRLEALLDARPPARAGSR